MFMYSKLRLIIEEQENIQVKVNMKWLNQDWSKDDPSMMNKSGKEWILVCIRFYNISSCIDSIMVNTKSCDFFEEQGDVTYLRIGVVMSRGSSKLLELDSCQNAIKIRLD